MVEANASRMVTLIEVNALANGLDPFFFKF